MSLRKIRLKCSPDQFLSQSVHTLKSEIKLPKNVGYFVYFQATAQSKQSHIGRKFVQSGHPVARRPRYDR
jgi:hypothetical protein